MKKYVKCTLISTSPITAEERRKILSIFNIYDQDVLDYYEDSRYYDGITYNRFVVECDNTNTVLLGGLLDALRRLESDLDIGYENESNEHGFYGKTYMFYHYVD